MGGSKEKQLDDTQRLLAMREYLGVRARPDQASFESEVVDASVSKVRSVIDRHAGACGETIIAAIARELCVRFEEVRTGADIEQLEQKYLVEKKELGFGLLSHELADPEVDALLFQRMHAQPDAPDRWVAVLNLQASQARAYWSRPHELTHRLAEPPQKRLPFFRHRTDAQNRVERIIDLGAAEGGLPVQLALAHPHLTGTGFDLPPVRPIFEDYVARFGLADRLQFRAGDFFSDPLPRADVIIMGHVLHDWSLEEKRQLIARAYAALTPGGAIVLYESIIDNDRRTNVFGLLMSLNMLIETPAGCDYTGVQCRGWLRDAGFRETYVEHLVGTDSMVVGVK